MRDLETLQEFLGRASVDTAVFALRPDYRAVLLAVDGLVLGPSDAASETLLQAAEASAQKTLDGRAVEELPHVAAWREAYKAFGARRNAHGTALRHCCAARRRACRG